MEQTELKIGEVATRAGVSVDALRYYERMKLLPRARRTSGGFRLFGSESIERVQFIKQAQELGLSLGEIRDDRVFARRLIPERKSHGLGRTLDGCWDVQRGEDRDGGFHDCFAQGHCPV